MNYSELTRFLDKVKPEPNKSCWLWTGYTRGGYGGFRLDGKNKTAHRVSYEYFVGSIPKGLDLDHLCRVRNCVNPAHLEPVTRSENCKRGESGHHHRKKQRAKTHCPHGHSYFGMNLYVDKRGWRQCRECSRLRKIERRKRLSKEVA